MNETTTGYVTFGNSTLSVYPDARITTDGTTAIWNNSIHGNYWAVPKDIKKDFLKNILEGFMELVSILGDESLEVYEIEEMTRKGNKTRILCHKEIDLDYADRIKSKSELLIESVPLADKDNNSFTFHADANGLVFNGSSLTTTTLSPWTWTYTSTGNTSSNNDIVVNRNINTYNYNLQGAISYA